MLIYSIIIILPFILSYFVNIKNNSIKLYIDYLWFNYLVFVLFIFSFRDKIGGDWNNYYSAFFQIGSNNLPKYDYGFNPSLINEESYNDSLVFYFLNYLIYKLSKSFVVFNLVCSLIYVYSINKFCSLFNNGRFIVFAFFITYLGIVVHLGYIRQSLSISLLALALYFYLKEKNILSFLLLTISFFVHLSVFPFFLLYIKNLSKYLKNRKIIYFSFSIIITIIFLYFIRDKIFLYFYYYLGEGVHFQSKGAYLRVLMSIPFFLTIYLLRNQIYISEKEWSLFKLFLLFLFVAILFLILNRTTFADRIALPLILFQGYVIGKIFSLLKYRSVKNIYILFTMMYSYLLFFIWAFYGQFTTSWLPYKNILFD